MRSRLTSSSKPLEIRHITREENALGPRPPLRRWDVFRRHPLPLMAAKVYSWREATRIPEPSQEDAITVVCISDTHATQPALPHGDLLLHAGDLSNGGSFAEIQTQLDWLNRQPHKHKVVIAGNHDFLLDQAFVERYPERMTNGRSISGKQRSDLRWGDIVYLQDQSVTLEFAHGRSLNIYGSPWTSEYGIWAFQYLPIRDVWTNRIPSNTDILLTHGPPKHHLDNSAAGSEHLLKELYRSRPPLVVFGHIHAGYGEEIVGFNSLQAAYEGILMGTQGWVALCKLMLLILVQKIYSAVQIGRSRSPSGATRLVNAAAVGGVANKERRAPITVRM